jgi:hypothetical protein
MFLWLFLSALLPSGAFVFVLTCGAGGLKKVWRHLRSGDMMLVNRQPTLHKPGT